MLLRLLGYSLLCIALAGAAYDGARLIADKGALAFTSVIEYWQMLGPESLAATREAIEQISPYVWSPLLMAVLVLPGWLVAGGLGILVYMAGYRRPRPTLPDGI
jgi:hypothetical protein